MRVKTLSLLDLGKIAELKPEQSSCNARLVTKRKLTANKKKEKKKRGVENKTRRSRCTEKSIKYYVQPSIVSPN